MLPTFRNCWFLSSATSFAVFHFSAVRCQNNQPLRVIVSYKDAARLATARIGAVATVHHQLDDTTIAATFPDQAAIEALDDDPAVEFVEPDPIRYLIQAPSTDTDSLEGDFLRPTMNNATDWHPHRQLTEQVPYGIRMVQADTLSTGSFPRTVCIIDTGYDLGHEDLPTLVKGYTGGTLRWDEDILGQGTHIAGVIGAIRNNGIGVIGVADKVNFFIMRFSSTWPLYASDLIDAMRQCRDAGAHIINLSHAGGNPSIAERRIYESFSNNGTLMVASPGHTVSSLCLYPASYPSVIAVTAIDQNENPAWFAPFHSQIELAAPGSFILSTVPFSASSAQAKILLDDGTSSGEAEHLSGSSYASASGPLADCGPTFTGETICTVGSAVGRVCLIRRGDPAESVQICENAGCVAAILEVGVVGPYGGNLGGYSASIPAVGISPWVGPWLRASVIGKIVTVQIDIIASTYVARSGTTMAAAHVSGVAALIWSHHPTCTAAQIRDVMACTAKDLGLRGHDHNYGHGLVQAREALKRLNKKGCNTCRGASSLRECEDRRGKRSCLHKDRCECAHKQCFTISRVTRSGECESTCAGGFLLWLRLRLRYSCGYVC